jgi:hypothetical protein
MSEEIQPELGINAEIYIEPVKDEEASAKEGRDVFRDARYIRLQAPGDRGNVIERPIRPEDEKRYPHAFEAFRRGDLASKGTPLSVLGVSPSQVKELEYFAVRSVEAFAAVSDESLSKMGPLRQWRDKAVAFVQAAKAEAPLKAQAAEIADLKAQISALKAGKK